MLAVGFREHGGIQNIASVDLPVPDPGPGQVRVRVVATVVNPVDVQFLRGDYVALTPEAVPPLCGGLEFVGYVDKIGEGAFATEGVLVAGTSHFIPGGRGAHAEYVLTDAAALAECPSGADPVAMATVPMNGLTARVTLDTLALTSGETVAVTGAAGAVGAYFTELAAGDGLKVIAIASPSDESDLRSIGATEFFARGQDVAARILEAHPTGVSAVVDAAMLDDQALALVADEGQFVSLRPGHVPEPERGVEPKLISFRTYQRNTGALRDLLKRANTGGLTPRVGEVFTADRGVQAFERADSPGVRGRAVLTFD